MRLILLIFSLFLNYVVSFGQQKDIFIFIDRSQGKEALVENYVEKKSTEKEIVFEKGIGNLGYMGIDYFIHKPKKHLKKKLFPEDFDKITFKTIRQIEQDPLYREAYKSKLNFHVTCFNIYLVELNKKGNYTLYEVDWFRSFNIE